MSRCTRTHPRVIILHAPVNIVWHFHIRANAIELPNRNIIQTIVRNTSIPAFMESRITRQKEVI